MPASHKGYKIFLRTVKDTISSHSMFHPDDSVLVGVSGGPDSIALIHVLLTIAPIFPLKLGIAHLNHSLRKKESDRDEEFVASLAQTLGLPCYIKRENVVEYQRKHRLSLEEAGRHLRYSFFDEIAEKNRFDKIALGHHCDDNAELILMYLFRGTGPLGISGIPPVRDRRIVRPLIKITRPEIIKFLAEKRLTYVSDQSNTDTRYLRNRIRHQLMPLLKQHYNPKIAESLNRLASITQSEEEWIEEIINPMFENSVLALQNSKIILSIAELAEMHTAAQKRIIRRAIVRIKGDLKRITLAHLDAIMNLLKSGPLDGRLDLPARIMVRRDNEFLSISKEKKPLRDLRDPETRPDEKQRRMEKLLFEYNILKPGSLYIKETGIRLKFSEIRDAKLEDICNAGHQVAFFDMKTISFPLVVRNSRPGDCFTPLGMTGTQKVKKFFVNKKVSLTDRLMCPVVLSKGKLIWVVGHRIDDSVRVKSSTGSMLKGELFLA
jgi:tRNA(Ile)-lysidine synthase